MNTTHRNKNTEALIKVHNLSFAYDKRNVLQNVNFEVNEGDCLAIVGPNGGDGCRSSSQRRSSTSRKAAALRKSVTSGARGDLPRRDAPETVLAHYRLTVGGE